MEAYNLVREIGKGAYGTAYIVQHKTTQQRWVLKKVRLARQTFKERQGSLRELQLLCSLAHRNILSCKEAWVEAGCIVCMLLELCESGDLSTQLKLRVPTTSFFPEAHLQEMLVQLASGLAFIHKNSIAHRDIKSSNILITAEGRLLLADFGLATILDEDVSVSKTLVGTPGYMAPQLLGDTVEYNGYKNDIWGLGCVLYEASALKPAFTAFNMAGLVKKVVAGSAPPLPSHYSEPWRNIIKAMLVKEEAKRPSAEEILALPWLQEAKQRVAQRFGPELPAGADEYVLLRQLPEGIQKLAESFKQQQQEAEEKLRVDNERRKVLQAKYAPRGLLQKQALQELAAIPGLEGVLDAKRPAAAAAGAAGAAAGAVAGARGRAVVHTAALRRPGVQPGTKGLVTPAAANPRGAAYRQSDVGGCLAVDDLDAEAVMHSPQRPGSAPPSPSRLKEWDGDGPVWESEQPAVTHMPSSDGPHNHPTDMHNHPTANQHKSTSQPLPTVSQPPQLLKPFQGRASSNGHLPAQAGQGSGGHPAPQAAQARAASSGGHQPPQPPTAASNMGIRKSMSEIPKSSVDPARQSQHLLGGRGSQEDAHTAGKQQQAPRVPVSSSFGARPNPAAPPLTPRSSAAAAAAAAAPGGAGTGAAGAAGMKAAQPPVAAIRAGATVTKPMQSRASQPAPTTQARTSGLIPAALPAKPGAP